MAKAIGIDLGTSTSSVAVFDGKTARLLSAMERERVMPTVVQHDPTSGEVRVGEFAHRTSITNSDYTYRGLKRLLGRQYNDPIVQEMSEGISYNLSRGPNGEAWVKTPGGQASPEELLSHVVKRLKDIAQTAMGEQVSFAVVGVPANFDAVQREAVRRACGLAGLEARQLVSEPTAAALAYGMERGLGKTIAVYDLGGGTFDTTILKVTDRRYRVLATAGDSFLGGDDFDTRLVDWVSERFMESRGFDPRGDRLALQRLRLAVEKAKIELSSAPEYRLFEARFVKDVSSHILVDLDVTITRDTFEELVEDLIDRTRQPCLDVLRMAKVDPRQIDDVVLVGGMTRMPRVHQVVEDLFGRAPAVSKLSPVEAVTLGCAIRAAALAGETKIMQLDDITASNFGLEAGGGAFLPIIKRGSRVPISVTKRTGPYEDMATRVAAHIFQGNAGVARDNRRLGTLGIDGLPARKAGLADVDVTFSLDEDAILTVTLTDVENERSVSKRIHAETGLDSDDLDQVRGIDEDAETGPVDEPEAVEEDARPQDSGQKATEAAENFEETAEAAAPDVSAPADDTAEPAASEPAPADEDDFAPPNTPTSDSAPVADEPAAATGPEAGDFDDPPPMPAAARWEKVAAE